MDEITGWTEVDPVLGFGVGYGRTLNGGLYMSEDRGGASIGASTGWIEENPVLWFGVGYGRTLDGGWYMSEYRGGDVVDVFEKDEEDGRWVHVSTVYLEDVGIVDRDRLRPVAVTI